MGETIITGYGPPLTDPNEGIPIVPLPLVPSEHERRQTSDDNVVVVSGAVGPPGPTGPPGPQGVQGPVGPEGSVSIEQLGLKQNKHGFPLLEDGTYECDLDYDYANRTITIVGTGGSFDVYVKGEKFTKVGLQAAPMHAAVDGSYFVYYDETGTLVVSQTEWDLREVSPVAFIFWRSNGTYVALDERHTIYGDPGLHAYLHKAIGTSADADGFQASGYQLATDTAAAVTPDISSGVIRDEDIKHIVEAQPAGSYVQCHKIGDADDVVITTGNALPYLYSPGGYIQYNQWNGSAFQLTQLTNGQFVIYTAFALPTIDTSRRLMWMPGETVYASLEAASADFGVLPSFGSGAASEFVAVYQIIFRANASYVTDGKVRIEALRRIHSSRVAGVAFVGGVGGFLPLTGGTLTGALIVPDGSAAAPSVRFTSEASGLCLINAGNVGIAVSGGAYHQFTANRHTINAATASLALYDTFLVRDGAAHILAMRNGANPQTLRLYSTHTDASNGSWLEFLAGSGGQNIIRSNANGTGSNLVLGLVAQGGYRIEIAQTSIRPSVDAVVSLGGSASLRWRDLFVGGVAAAVPVNIKLHASQTANALEVKSSSDVVLAGINATGRIISADGAAATPGLQLGSAANGFSLVSSTLRWSLAGVQCGQLGSDQIALGSGLDVILRRDAANVLTMRNGTNPQGMVLYNSYNEPTGSEYGYVQWSANVLIIGTGKTGTGTNRGVSIVPASGFFSLTATALPGVDATYDLGAGTFRWRVGYFGGAAASVPVLVKLHASQTANALEVRSSADAVLARILPTGEVEGKVVTCKAYHNTSQSITSGTDTAVALNSEQYDTDAMHDNATNNSRVKAPSAGRYRAYGRVRWQAGTTGYRALRITKNAAGAYSAGVTLGSVLAGAPSSSVVMDQEVSCEFSMAANDYIELNVGHNQGSALNLETLGGADGNSAPQLILTKLGV